MTTTTTTTTRRNRTKVARFAKLSVRATTPTRASSSAAGYDLCSAYDYDIAAGERQLVLTDLSLELPRGCYGRVASRSGLALKHRVDVAAGIIDRDYRGNVGIVLVNNRRPTDNGSSSFRVTAGDRVAQLLLERIIDDVTFVAVERLDETTRADSGFGSTGVGGRARASTPFRRNDTRK